MQEAAAGPVRSLKVAEGGNTGTCIIEDRSAEPPADPWRAFLAFAAGAGPAAFRQVVTRQRRLIHLRRPSVIQALICDRAVKAANGP